jgi:hypothetical protein
MINLFRNNFSISRCLFVCFVLSIIVIEIPLGNYTIEKCAYHVVFPDLTDSEEEKDSERLDEDLTTENYCHFLPIRIFIPETFSFISNSLPPVVYLGSWSPPPQA